jgi:hypothetical protein
MFFISAFVGITYMDETRLSIFRGLNFVCVSLVCCTRCNSASLECDFGVCYSSPASHDDGCLESRPK